MRKIWALALKDLRLLYRDPAGLAFTLLFPLGFALFFGMVYSGDNGPEAIPIAVVDLDQTPGSRSFVARLDSSIELDVQEMEDTLLARELVRKRQCAGMLILPEGFGEKRENPFANGSPQVVLGFDPSQAATAGMIEGILTRYAAEDLSRTFTDPGKLRASVRASIDSLRKSSSLPQAERKRLLEFLGALDTFLADQDSQSTSGFEGFQPLTIKRTSIIRSSSGPPNAFAITFPQGIVFGIISVVSSFSLSIVVERKNGTLNRIRALPVTGVHILAGKALSCFIATLGVVLSLIAAGALLFGVHVNSVLLLLLASAAVGVGFVGIMLLFSVLGRSERSASLLAWGTLLPLAMLGGAMIPLAFMPGWLRGISSLSPVKWAILGLEGAIWRNFSLGEMLVPVVILLTVGCVSFAIGVRLFRWSAGQESGA